jgi:hypothetical protein
MSDDDDAPTPTNGILFQTEQDLGQICAHMFSVTSGSAENIILGGNNQMVVGENGEIYLGVKFDVSAIAKMEYNVADTHFDGKFQKVFGEKDEIGPLRNELNAVSNKIFGKNADVVAEDVKATLESQVTEVERSTLVGDAREAALEKASTVLEETKTIAHAMRVSAETVEMLAERTVMSGTDTQQAATREIISSTTNLISAITTIA